MTRYNKLRRSESNSNLHLKNDTIKTSFEKKRSFSTNDLNKSNEPDLIFKTIKKLSQKLKKQDAQLEQIAHHMSKQTKQIKHANYQANLSSAALVAGAAAYIIANNWAAITNIFTSIGTTLMPVLPTIGIGTGVVIGVIAALGVIGFCAYKAYQHRAEIKEAAGKAVEKVKNGVEYTAGKIKDGARFAGIRLKHAKNDVLTKVADTAHKLSDQKDFLDQRLSESEREKSNISKIKEKFEEIFNNDKPNSKKLVQDILSKIKEKLDDSISEISKTVEDIKKMDKDDPNYKQKSNNGKELLVYIKSLQSKKDFINSLNPHNLKDYLTTTAPSTLENRSSLYSIFVDHCDLVKQAIEECKSENYFKESHYFKDAVRMFEQKTEEVNPFAHKIKNKLSKLLPHSAKNQSKLAKESTQHDDRASVKSSISEPEKQPYDGINAKSLLDELNKDFAAIEREKKGSDSSKSLGSDGMQDTASVSSLDSRRSTGMQPTLSTSTLASDQSSTSKPEDLPQDVRSQMLRNFNGEMDLLNDLAPLSTLQHPKVELTIEQGRQV
ncbi:hypothetical protein BIY23_04400 [Wolbachia pipientis]|uniref:Uncharacterized protein n=1 Tax=Wolbachia pipientis TaxID=955 RepID=A0A1E7QJG2_WOLPI|nr:hypothetical protein [Wolbachia pipientis]OEY86364.1 hypothetical protein BIY23_04400 [Wolbachia pipientis]